MSCFCLSLRVVSTRSRGLVVLGLVLACSSQPGGLDDFGTGSGSTGTGDGSNTDTSTSTGATGTTTSGEGGTNGSGDSDGPTTRFDVGDSTGTGGGGVCYVGEDELTGEAPCTNRAPPDSFEPRIEWTWDPPKSLDLMNYSIITPLVANLTDDRLPDGIDLCDTPDIVVVVRTENGSQAANFCVLDGDAGEAHFCIDEDVAFITTPALGDIDGDGLVEIVTRTPIPNNRLIAFEHDGTLNTTAANFRQ